jgi:predicted transcriptional regulator
MDFRLLRVILRYDNENQTPGRHERPTPEGIEEIEFPRMMELRDGFINEIQDLPWPRTHSKSRTDSARITSKSLASDSVGRKLEKSSTNRGAAFILNFEDFDDVEGLIGRVNLQLLDVVASERPESIRETARLVDCDYKEVHRNLKEVQALGVIEFTTDGNSKRPILRDGAKAIDLSITFPVDTDTSNSPSHQETSAWERNSVRMSAGRWVRSTTPSPMSDPVNGGEIGLGRW